MSAKKFLSMGAGAKTHSEDRLSSYLAIDVSQVKYSMAHKTQIYEQSPADHMAEKLQALTPRLMQWSESLWLLDLSVCKSYWRARAKLQETTAINLLRGILQELIGESYLAVLVDHPWRALLLARHMQERRLVGLVTCQGVFGENLYRDLSWKSWWRAGWELAQHLQKLGGKRFDAALFRRQCAQMQRAVKRLGITKPGQLSEVASLSIKRRFGATLRDMWQWAYDAQKTSGAHRELFADIDGPFTSGFPWRSFEFATLPEVHRDLDDPLCEWQHIEPCLRDDFDRLCGQASWLAGEKVVSLEWRLVLRDLSCHLVPIHFRHPHSLHLEKGCQTTALLQALYAFEASILGTRSQSYKSRTLRRKRSPRTSDGERHLVAVPSPIVAWDLVIKERMTILPRSVGFFGEQKISLHGEITTFSTEEELLQLENKLPLPLMAFNLREDWLPEDSFAETVKAELSPRDFQGLYRPSLMAMAHHRPLYLYAKPQPLDGKGRSSLWEFTERTMNKWWQTPGEAAPSNIQRDYYRLTEADGRALWVFKNARAEWYIQGIYA